MLDEGAEESQQFFAGRQIFFQPHPGMLPASQVATIAGSNIGGE
jgi:hypothetical protein